MGCPDTACQNRVSDFIHDTKETLYGTGLEHGGLLGKVTELKLCISKKVSKKAVFTTVLAIFVALTPFIIYGMGKWGTQREKIQKNREKILVIQKQYTHIQETVDEIKEKQLTREDIAETLRKVLKPD